MIRSGTKKTSVTRDAEMKLFTAIHEFCEPPRIRLKVRPQVIFVRSPHNVYTGTYT